ncbi:EAL domain-containing protein [Simiduia curdlanivorans]|uniref:EAL domain-containing protein n=1 Tax=Simiduia curdlanivorans TaxID=1492769 RepID=A0ABV8V5G6_9GAMM|nr:EAL domain-containing protein [Simiduia curdlanivorans]MDN3638237.1 EAL domain-containing protein [Simiduia curdlanivorans]
MNAPIPHIDSKRSLAEACALFVMSGASSLIVEGAQPIELSLNQLKTWLEHPTHSLSTTLENLFLADIEPAAASTTPVNECPTHTLQVLLHDLAQTSTDAIYIKDTNGQYLFANEAYACAIGHPLKNIIGATDLSLSTPALAQKSMQIDKQILSTETIKTFEENIANQIGVSTYLTTKGPVRANGTVLGTYGVLRDFGKLHQAQQERDQHESELEAILQSLPDLFFRLGADGTILDYRAQTETELYRPAKEFLGKRMQDVLPQDLGELFLEKLDEQRATKGLVCYEYELELPTGTTRFEARLRNINGFDEFIILIRNITTSHNEKKALNHVKQQLAMALDAAKEGVWDWDLESGKWTANGQFFTMLGYPPEPDPQPIKRWNEKIHPDDVARRNQAYSAIMRGETETFDVEFRARNNANQYQWLRAKGKVAEYCVNNKARRIVGTHEDITQQKILEEKLKLAATVFNNTAEGVIIADPKGYIIEVNQGFEDVTGFKREDVIGKHTRLLNSGRQAPAFYRAMWKELTINGSWKGEIWNKRKDGSLVPEWLNISAVKDVNNTTSHFVAVFSDISVLKRSEEKLDHMAHHDTLTGLPNRLMLQARMGRALVHAHRNKHAIALLFLDIDRFKNINDSMGHHIGDSLLKQVAARLKTCVRNEDTVARLGGDEFVVLLENLIDPSAPAQVAEKILHEIRKPFELQSKDFYTTTSIGISVYPTDGTSPSELLRNADTAMYQVKHKGRDSFTFYTQRFTDAARKKAEMESELHKAIAHNEMQLWYQPQFNLSTEEIIGMEALIRWIHPSKGMIAPDLFIPLAEESGLIVKIGEWVINQSCAQIRHWLNNNISVPRIGINISGAELRQGELVNTLAKALNLHAIPGKYLEVEITENFMMEDMEKAVKIINELKSMGIEVAIDDFGTGYSSLSYLKALPIRRLKIDKSFVADIPNSTHDVAITKAIIAMAHSLGLEVIAEGVETREQQNFLHDNACNFGQGYLFCRPSTAENIECWLSKEE